MIAVTKATGEIEEFSEEKLRNSIQRAGVPQQLQNQAIDHIKSRLTPNIKTSEIYQHIKEFLTEKQPFAVAKFSLKQAIMDLGPTGYPFESFIAKILETKGYVTQIRQILQGKCITHEVDVVAQKGSERVMVEAKYHNMPGTKTNIHVALYIKARFDDLLDKNNLNQAWLVTNTKITQDAIAYSACMNMKVISWNYPEGEGLRDLIEQSGLTPITALSSLSNAQKQKLLQEDIVFSKELCRPDLLKSLGLSKADEEKLLSEIKFACNLNTT